MEKKVSVIIPAFNEEKWVGDTVKAVTNIHFIKEIIVVDDGSEDNTCKEARAAGARVFRHKKNRGKGEALKTGVRLSQYSFLVFIDADLKKTAALVEPLIFPVLEDMTDMSIAVLPGPKKKGFGLVKKIARHYIKYRTGFFLAAPLSGQRGLKKEVWNQVKEGSDNGFGIEITLSLNALRKGYRLMEIPLSFKHRERGKDLSSFCHRGKQFFAVVKVLLGDICNGCP